MILRRQLAPGTQIRQVELAERLGLRRSPLRQALSALEPEGLVTHEQQRGYFVTRMSADHLSQVYRMRELLETELLRTMRRPRRRSSTRWRCGTPRCRRRLDDGVGDGDAGREPGGLPLRPVRAVAAGRDPGPDVERLWNASEPYRATYLWLPATRRRIVRERARRKCSTRSRESDRARLVQIANRHRDAARAAVTELLAVEAL